MYRSNRGAARDPAAVCRSGGRWRSASVAT